MFKKNYLNTIQFAVKDFKQKKIPYLHQLMDNIRKEWKNLVGNGIAKHTYPFGIKNGVLNVHVDDPIWVSELTLHKDEIKSNIVERFPHVVKSMQSVRFRVGELKAIEETEDKPLNLKIEPAVLAKIEEKLKDIEDVELKESLRQYFINVNLKAVQE